MRSLPKVLKCPQCPNTYPCLLGRGGLIEHARGHGIGYQELMVMLSKERVR